MRARSFRLSHFWPGVRSGRPELSGDLAVGLLGRARKAWRGARTARGETNFVCGVSAASFAEAVRGLRGALPEQKLAALTPFAGRRSW
jgi:hypothetical protein